MIGIILAGGRSRRLGRDKATAKILGKPMLAWVYEALRDGGATEVVMVAQPGQRFDALPSGVIRIDDERHAGVDGPLAALDLGLRYARDAQEEFAFVAPCDVPALHPEDVQRALSRLAEAEYDAVLMSSGPKGPHPLLGAYRVGPAAAAAGRSFGNGERAARAILSSLNITVLNRFALRRAGATAPCNTGEELQAMEGLVLRSNGATVPHMNSTLVALILAAGKGTRMRSDLPKVLHTLQGRPLLHHVLDVASEAGADRSVIVIGYQGEMVRASVEDAGYREVGFAHQAEQRGTGHAVQCALAALRSGEDVALILSGDVPGIRRGQIESLLRLLDEETALALMTFKADDPTGYGRIVRDSRGEIACIREEKDASPLELKIQECNAGVYVVRVELLASALPTFTDLNVAGEVYLTDLVAVASAVGDVRALRVAGADVAGVNTPEQLAGLEREFESRDPA